MAALALAGPAAAGQIDVHLSFVAGKLSISAPVAKLSPAGSATLQVTVADGRGNGAGWQLMSMSRLSVRSITATCAAGSTCTLPRAASAPSGTTVLHAAKGTGMGVIVLRIAVTGSPGRTVALAVR